MTRDFREPLGAALQQALDHLESRTGNRIASEVGYEELRTRLIRPLQQEPLNPLEVVKDLALSCQDGIHRSCDPRFFGWVIGGALPAALAADWLTSVWDQNAALFACGPAAAIVEEAVGAWLKQLLPVNSEASFALVTGTQMAHVTCLAAARHSLLSKLGIDVELRGLAGTPPIKILTSSEKHGSLVRAVRLLGLGEENVVSLSADNGGQLEVETLQEALRSVENCPTVVVLQAGDLNIGAFDDFGALTPIAHSAGAWVHIDGAFGLWANASRNRAKLLNGAEQADSWTVDGHKWLNVPYDCGYAFIADRGCHAASLTHRASYLTHDAHVRDQMDWTPEWSRRARGFATYAALRQLGRSGLEELIERTCRCAHEITMGIGGLPGAEVLWEPTINQGLVRFLSPVSDATSNDHSLFTDSVIAAINRSGFAFFTGTTWRSIRAMRISVCNWQVSDEDVAEVVSAVSRVLKMARSAELDQK